MWRVLFLTSIFAMFSSTAVAQDDACSRRNVTIDGVLDRSTQINEPVTLGIQSLDIAPQAMIPTPESTAVKGIALRFVRVHRNRWLVHAASIAFDRQEKTPLTYYGPVAGVDFGSDGAESFNQFTTFVPIDRGGERKVEISVTLNDLHMQQGVTNLSVNEVSADLQACPTFGKVVVSQEEARHPDRRFKVLSEDGRDITDEVSISTGAFPILKRDLGKEAE